MTETTPEDELLAMQTVYETLAVLPEEASRRVLDVVSAWLYGEPRITSMREYQTRQALMARLHKKGLSPEAYRRIYVQAVELGIDVSGLEPPPEIKPESRRKKTRRGA